MSRCAQVLCNVVHTVSTLRIESMSVMSARGRGLDWGGALCTNDRNASEQHDGKYVIMCSGKQATRSAAHRCNRA